MTDLLAQRGLTADAVIADMNRVMAAYPAAIAAIDAVGVSSAYWYTVCSGKRQAGEALLNGLYGPHGRTIRPELLGNDVPIEVDVSPPPAPPTSMSPPESAPAVTDLLAYAQRRADALETELDEAIGEVETLKALIARFEQEAS